MEQLWHNVDAAIVSPRMNINKSTPPGVEVQDHVLKIEGQADHTIESLLSDLEKVLGFLADKLPSDLLQPLSKFMMADIVPRLINTWLDSSVPSSLKQMDSFQAMIQSAGKFHKVLKEHGYSGLEDLKAWVDDAPSIWLGKCRETTLDTVRRKLLRGIGESRQVEKVEKQMVSIAEGKELVKTPGAGANAENSEWGAWGDGDAWDEEEEAAGNPKQQSPTKKKETNVSMDGDDDGAGAWGWDDEDTMDETDASKAGQKDDGAEEDDESAAAWGWGDDDGVPESTPQSSPKKSRSRAPTATKELVLRETYNISSMPEPVLELIYSTLEDGATLTKEGSEYTPVASTAPGLFSLPTFVLALFRAISPYYYSLNDGGNM